MMLDAGSAFRYARGAVWHLEVALPQLEAAAGGATQHADALAAAATGHVRAAVGDLARARELGGITAVDQARTGALLTTTGGALAPTAATFDAVLGARLEAQGVLGRITPHLQAPEELLSLAPAAEAPAHELGLITSIADARRFRVTSDVQRSTVMQILAKGSIDPEPIRWVGGYGNGNGAMPMVRVRHPETPHLSVAAVHRPATSQAAQEEFFARLAEHAGVDQHFAPVARRSDGSALVLAVPGHQLWDEVHSGDDIARVMGDWYRLHFPGLDAEQARRAGRIDFDAAKALDHLTAQPDRNAGSPLGDVATGELRFIDNGFAGRGELHDPLRPALKSHYMGGMPGRLELLPEAAAQVTRRLDDAALADAHAVLRNGPDGDLPAGHAFALAQDASDGFLANMRARRDQLRTGTADYVPVGLNADPLKHVEWLRTMLPATR